jgi:hypothetical protein
MSVGLGFSLFFGADLREGPEEAVPDAGAAGIEGDGERPDLASGMGSNFTSTDTSSTDWEGCTGVCSGASMKANRIKKLAWSIAESASPNRVEFACRQRGIVRSCRIGGAYYND